MAVMSVSGSPASAEFEDFEAKNRAISVSASAD